MKELREALKQAEVTIYLRHKATGLYASHDGLSFRRQNYWQLKAYKITTKHKLICDTYNAMLSEFRYEYLSKFRPSEFTVELYA